MFCPSCGHDNADNAKFCQKCGGPLQAAQADTGGSPPTSPPPQQPPSPQPSFSPGGGGTIDIGGWISNAFNEVFSDIGGYIVLALVVYLVSGVTFGILAGPLLGAAFIFIRKKLHGQGSLDIGGVFNLGLENFGQAFLVVFIPCLVLGIVYSIVWGLLIATAFIPVLKILVILLSIVVGLIYFVIGGLLYPFFALALHYIFVDRMDSMPAARKAIDMVKKNLMMYWLFGIITAIIGGIGSIACGIGVLLTMPVALVMLVYFIDSQTQAE